MYLTEPSLNDIVKKQFLHKLNAYTGVFSSLLIIQLIGLFIGFENGGGGGSSGGTVITEYTFSTGDVPVLFTLFWALLTGILVTTLAYRNDAFSFVSNRISHNLSSILFLMLASTIAGITAVLAGSVIKLFALFQSDLLINEASGLLSSPVDFFIRIATSILYTLLFASLGYVTGSFIQRSKLVIPLILVAFFLVPMLRLDVGGINLMEKVIFFYGTETSLLIFLIKIVVTISVLFAISIALTNNTEVRK